jgi:hypothetical protein
LLYFFFFPFLSRQSLPQRLESSPLLRTSPELAQGATASSAAGAPRDAHRCRDAATFCRRAPLSRPALREAEDERGEAGWDGEDGAMRLGRMEAGVEKPLRSPAPARARAVGEAGGRASAGGRGSLWLVQSVG